MKLDLFNHTHPDLDFLKYAWMHLPDVANWTLSENRIVCEELEYEIEVRDEDYALYEAPDTDPVDREYSFYAIVRALLERYCDSIDEDLPYIWERVAQGAPARANLEADHPEAVEEILNFVSEKHGGPRWKLRRPLGREDLYYIWVLESPDSDFRMGIGQGMVLDPYFEGRVTHRQDVIWAVDALLSRHFLTYLNHCLTEVVETYGLKQPKPPKPKKIDPDTMGILEQVFNERLEPEDTRDSRSSIYLADAMFSRINGGFMVNLSRQTCLDDEGQGLFDGMMLMHRHPDYSNRAQDAALERLRALYPGRFPERFS